MNSHSNRLPECGAVLGVDIGWSPNRRTNAACRLDWTSTAAQVHISRVSLPGRRQLLLDIADRSLVAAAFDGPLRADLAIIGRYRLAEQLLTRGFQPLIGKPGQASAPVGRLLNQHANECARIVVDATNMGKAAHDHAIHELAVAEAFPTSFLGVLIENPSDLSSHRGNRSDTFYVHLDQSGGLLNLLQRLLPGRAIHFDTIKDHEERAALVCALTALCVAAGDYTAVGDEDGWIVLPPRSLIRPWAWTMLSENANGIGLETMPLAATP